MKGGSDLIVSCAEGCEKCGSSPVGVLCSPTSASVCADEGTDEGGTWGDSLPSSFIGPLCAMGDACVRISVGGGGGVLTRSSPLSFWSNELVQFLTGVASVCATAGTSSLGCSSRPNTPLESTVVVGLAGV